MIKNFNIAQFATTVTSCGVLFGFVGWLILPRVDDKIETVTKDVIAGVEYKLMIDQKIDAGIRDFVNSATFEAKLQDYLIKNNSNNIDILALLAEKMGIPKDEVVVKISEMYLKDHPRLINLLRCVNAYHPDCEVWTIDN
jgi:hypothetical protein